MHKNWRQHVSTGVHYRSVLNFTLEIIPFGNGFTWVIRDEFGPHEKEQWADTLEEAKQAVEAKAIKTLQEAIKELSK